MIFFFLKNLNLLFEYSDYQNSISHQIIKLLNPGESSNVLQQDKNSNGYKTTSKITPNTTYILSVWVAYSTDWDGNKNLFKISQSQKSDKNIHTIDAGELVESKTIDNIVWMKKEYIFTSSSRD